MLQPLTLTLPPVPSDKELALFVKSVMDAHWGDRILRATMAACRMLADEATDDPGTVSRDEWNRAADLVGQAEDVVGW
jgi:hypothetical protein